MQIGIAGVEVVDLAGTDLAGFVACRCRDLFPVRHFRLANRLAVDCPAWAMIVRMAVLRSAIDMGTDAETEIRIFVQNLAFFLIRAAKPFFDKGTVGQHRLEGLNHFLAPLRTGVGGKSGFAGGGEIFECV